MKRVHVIDSHTGGEPTRVVVSGGPDLGRGSLAERLARFRHEHDHWRSALVNEPRGSDVLVGALLLPPEDPECVTGVIFFNNVGYLGMCGHGTIGLMTTLAHLGRIEPGTHRLETPVGAVEATLHPEGSVSLENVPSFRKQAQLTLEVPGVGAISGDVAWGGNWFFLTEEHGQDLRLENVEALTEAAWRVRQAVNSQGFPEVDHIEFFGPPRHPKAQSRSFVLCPGKAYDRSPCGTGTSAKLACLAADGKLPEGQVWIQESLVGSTFQASYRWGPDRLQILPRITGRAYLTTDATLLLEDADPFLWGIRSEG